MELLLSRLFVLFFFSSRRRHTRWPRDWSSDVCSSDLVILYNAARFLVLREQFDSALHPQFADLTGDSWNLEIGRASCRERVKNIKVGADRKKEIKNMTKEI